MERASADAHARSALVVHQCLRHGRHPARSRRTNIACTSGHPGLIQMHCLKAALLNIANQIKSKREQLACLCRRTVAGE